MNVKRVLTLGIVGGAVVVWFAAASTSPNRAPQSIEIAKPTAVDVSGAELAKEIARLHERLRPTAQPIESRDLFRYAPRASRAVPTVPRPAIVEERAPVEPTTPSPLTLVGIAEDQTADGTVRTAIVSGFGQLFMVKEAEAVTDRFRVQRISADTVQLEDQNDHTTLNLVLK